MTKVLKLGGSVVTRKDVPETVDEQTLAALAATIGQYDGGDLVVVHGGGSFGHHHASAHGVSRTVGTHDPDAVTDIHRAMVRLNTAVVDAFHAEEIPAVPVDPLSAGFRNAVDDLVFPTGQVSTLLREGFVPVMHGDVIAHEGSGVTILSGDELVAELADHLNADRVGLCSAVPGVLDADGAVVATIESFADVADFLGGSESTDVTGGMARKVRELLALDTPAYIFDVEGVGPFLAGDTVGTRVD